MATKKRAPVKGAAGKRPSARTSPRPLRASEPDASYALSRRRANETAPAPAGARTRRGAPVRSARERVAAALLQQLSRRLIEQMDDHAVLQDLRLDYLARATGSARQTARRWIDAKQPGLPDLVSFALLCEHFQADANWLLGLADVKLSLPPQQPDWVGALTANLLRLADGRSAMPVEGDEMEPQIRAGDWVLVDLDDNSWGGSGVFVVEHLGKRVLRTVDTRIGEGFLLGCANPRYAATLIRDEAAARELGVALIGRVVHRIAIGRV
jgi:hypothetical protein